MKQDCTHADKRRRGAEERQVRAYAEGTQETAGD
jgi:hypothetical protein